MTLRRLRRRIHSWSKTHILANTVLMAPSPAEQSSVARALFPLGHGAKGSRLGRNSSAWRVFSSRTSRACWRTRAATPPSPRPSPKTSSLAMVRSHQWPHEHHSPLSLSLPLTKHPPNPGCAVKPRQEAHARDKAAPFTPLDATATRSRPGCRSR